MHIIVHSWGRNAKDLVPLSPSLQSGRLNEPENMDILLGLSNGNFTAFNNSLLPSPPLYTDRLRTSSTPVLWTLLAVSSLTVLWAKKSSVSRLLVVLQSISDLTDPEQTPKPPSNRTSVGELLFRRAFAEASNLSTSKNEDIFENPAESYEAALKKHGSVIGVRRKGRVNHCHFDHTGF